MKGRIISPFHIVISFAKHISLKLRVKERMINDVRSMVGAFCDVPLHVRAERLQELIAVSTLLFIARCEFPKRVTLYFIVTEWGFRI